KTINRVFRVQISGFYSLLFDAIERRDFPFQGVDSLFYNGSYKKTQAMTNVGRAYIAGADIRLSADIGKNFSLVSMTTFTRGRDADEDLPLRHSAPVFGHASAILKAKKFKGELAFH